MLSKRKGDNKEGFGNATPDAIFNGGKKPCRETLNPSTVMNSKMDLIVSNDSRVILNAAQDSGMTNFIVFLKPHEDKIHFNNSFIIKKEIIGKITAKDNIEEMKITRSGSVLIKVNNAKLANELCKITKIINTSVSASLELETITSKFIIRGVDLEYTLNEIVTDLKGQGIFPIRLKRFVKQTSNTSFITKSILVTQIGKYIPAEVKIFYENFHVFKFEERPKQCQNCFIYGHSSISCRRGQVCVFCGENSEGVCQNDHTSLKCKNCGGAHPANDEICNFRKKEEAICGIKNENICSRHEAIQIYQNLKQRKHKYSIAASQQPPQNYKIEAIELRLKKLEESLEKKMYEKLEHMEERIVAFLTRALVSDPPCRLPSRKEPGREENKLPDNQILSPKKNEFFSSSSFFPDKNKVEQNIQTQFENSSPEEEENMLSMEWKEEDKKKSWENLSIDPFSSGKTCTGRSEISEPNFIENETKGKDLPLPSRDGGTHLCL